MYVRIVTFTLDGPVEAALAYRRHAAEIAPAFLDWPGLIAKVWLAEPATRTYGGVSLFTGPAAADRVSPTDLFRGLAANPAFADLTVREFDTLEAPTSVTAAAVGPVGVSGGAA